MWQLWCDTGGTFTDTLASDPAGKTHRLKILSSSRYRCNVSKKTSSRSLCIDTPFEPLSDDLFYDYSLSILHNSSVDVLGNQNRTSFSILSSGRDGSITVDRDLPPLLGCDTCIELVSPEDAPLFSARLITGTRLGMPLPPMTLRLATTRATNTLLTRNGAILRFLSLMFSQTYT